VKDIQAVKRIWPKVALITLACLALITPALASASSTHSLSRHVIAGGGGQMDGTGHTIMGTIGQPLVGSMFASGDHSLCSGFWCIGAVEYKVYLPLVLRNF
jgi:hypothetical protein